MQTDLGPRWRHSYDRRVVREETTGIPRALVYRGNGQGFYYSERPDGTWAGDPDVIEHLAELTDGQGTTLGWRYTAADDTVESYDAQGRLTGIARRGRARILTYDAAGRLAKVTGAFGRTLSFTYDANGSLATLTDPAGGVYRYSYDANENLAAVAFPDDTPADDADNPTRLYHYENAGYPHALTGITDENGQRFATYGYDAQGRAMLSEHAGGAGQVAITYHADGSSTVTDAHGRASTYSFQIIQGVLKTTGVTGPCASCAGTSQATT